MSAPLAGFSTEVRRRLDDLDQEVRAGGLDPAIDLIVSWAITATLVGSALFVPWARLPAGWQVLPPLSLYVVAALVRDATGGASSTIT